MRIATLFVLMGVTAVFAAAQTGWGRNQARSMTMTRQGMAATSQMLASETGARILARGGSAADAAIASNAVLGLVEPMMDGIGGDLFVLYWDAKAKEYVGLNASGPAPKALTPEFLAGKGMKEMPTVGIHTVTVPGAVDGWAMIHARFGKLPWKDLFDDAIYFAENGFPVTEVIQEQWADAVNLKKLRVNPASVKVFLPGGKPVGVGEVFRNPGLAKAYRLIATQGRDAFYKGDIAKAILKTSAAEGGTMTAADLAGYSSEWVKPISIDYRGWRVLELPPNGQGMAALEILNIMQTLPVGPGPLSPAEMHKRIEATKLAFADLRKYDADPRTYTAPVETLLSRGWAERRAKLIDPVRANCKVTPGDVKSGDTTYLTVVDRDGNMASWIQSVAHAWGSAVTVEEMGFPLHNRGWGFTLDPKDPDVLAGGKRPFHTIIPAFMDKKDDKGDARLGFGIMGGMNQPLAHAQFVSNIVDFGMNIQAALEAPRFTKNSAAGCDVSIEVRVPAATLQRLSEYGHEILIRREFTQEMGRGQAILHDGKTGTNFGASDPRADGAAVPEPLKP